MQPSNDEKVAQQLISMQLFSPDSATGEQLIICTKVSDCKDRYGTPDPDGKVRFICIGGTFGHDDNFYWR